MEDYAERRDELVKSVERNENELRQAVSDLKEAVSRPLQIVEQVTREPLPWILSGILIGVWLGARSNGNGSEY